jgi:hypothetical protein
MGFGGDLLNRLLQALGIDALWQLLTSKFPVINKLLDLAKKVIEHFTGVFQAAVALFKSAQTEFEAWKHFKEDIRFKQRVIVVEQALKKLEDLVHKIVDAWKEILSLIKNAGVKLETGGAAEIAEAASGVGLPLAVINAIVLVVEVLDTVRNLIDTAQNIVDVVTGVREFLQGDFIFLQQKNTRRVLKLDDGSSIKIRVGNLHS